MMCGGWLDFFREQDRWGTRTCVCQMNIIRINKNKYRDGQPGGQGACIILTEMTDNIWADRYLPPNDVQNDKIITFDIFPMWWIVRFILYIPYVRIYVYSKRTPAKIAGKSSIKKLVNYSWCFPACVHDVKGPTEVKKVQRPQQMCIM